MMMKMVMISGNFLKIADVKGVLKPLKGGIQLRATNFQTLYEYQLLLSDLLKEYHKELKIIKLFR